MFRRNDPGGESGFSDHSTQEGLPDLKKLIFALKTRVIHNAVHTDYQKFQPQRD
jgi:hypothetical protein